MLYYILCIYLKLNKYTYTCHYQDKDELFPWSY